MGGHRRGRKVSDMLAQLVTGEILVIDAKATAGAFDASLPGLRPLQEYTQRQLLNQKGQNTVFGALVVSSSFAQTDSTLASVSQGFYAAVGVPVSFCEARLLASIVAECRQTPTIRNGVAWKEMFAGGLVTSARFSRLLERTREERITRDGS